MSDPSHEDQHLPDEDPIEGLRRQLKPFRDADLAPVGKLKGDERVIASYRPPD
jgi:hypothetical protein